MDSTTSFVLAVVALVLSGASVIVAGWAIAQTRSYNPKPYFDFRHWAPENAAIDDRMPNQPTLRFMFANVGDAPARRVSVHVNGTEIYFVNVFPADFTMDDVVGLVTGTREHTENEWGGRIYPAGDETLEKIMFVVKWRQHPGNRQHKQKFVWPMDGRLQPT
jgi:hypothetical protein